MYALRKIRHLLSVEDSKLIYTSIVRSRLEYCATLFMFMKKGLSDKVESCQNKAIRLICKAPRTFSVTDGRRLLNLHTLASRRAFFYRQLVGKISCGTVATAIYRYINDADQRCSRELRSLCNLILPSINKNYGKHYNVTKL